MASENQLTSHWDHFKETCIEYPGLGFTFDYSKVQLPENYFNQMAPKSKSAFEAMKALEAGSIANPDENRKVGHYWLRAPELAPNPDFSNQIKNALTSLKSFVDKVHSGSIQGEKGPFKNFILVGIGGSCLGPQFVAQALGMPTQDKLQPYFIDNTDPDGIDSVLARIGNLGQTLVIVVSKSGSTPETANGMLEMENAYKKQDLNFAKHAVAVTSDGSQLSKHAQAQGWLTSFPMWDWVGGRTSELSSVGLLPAALQGINIDRMLKGAADMDALTRKPEAQTNPAMLMALLWYHLTDAKGSKAMVVLPYKDRLVLFSKYLQQLMMESLGKEKDLSGNIVNQGISVYGNKGSTDQHAYVQQLRDGVPNFFVTFIQILQDRPYGTSFYVQPSQTCGDFLNAFLMGTADALAEKNRASLTLTFNELTPETVGAMIALFERAVGFYASLVNVNAYHQPGVEAGKKAAKSFLDLQALIYDYLTKNPSQHFTAEQLATLINKKGDEEKIYKILNHLAFNSETSIIKETKVPFYNSQFYHK